MTKLPEVQGNKVEVASTPAVVDLADNVPNVTTRVLSDEEAENVRDRLIEIYNEHDQNQTVVADLIGIGQQGVGAIVNGRKRPGLVVAKAVARYDGVAVSSVLSGAPKNLYTALQLRNWHRAAAKAVEELWREQPSPRRYSVDEWVAYLEQLDANMRTLRMAKPRSHT